MTNDKLQNPNKSLRSKSVKYLCLICHFLIHLTLVIGILSFGSALPASAVSVTVYMDGTNQIIENPGGSPMPAGNVIQIIYASGEIHGPSPSGGAAGGDEIIWTGAVGEGGLGDGAFIKTFAGGQSLIDGSHIYVRGWDDPDLFHSAHYGNSVLSNTLEATNITENPPVPLEWAVPTFTAEVSFTPVAPASIEVEWVRMSGVRFRNNDIVSSHPDVEIRLSAEAGVATLELDVASGPSTPPPVFFTLEEFGTTFEGTWKGTDKLGIVDKGIYLLIFRVTDGEGALGSFPYTARITGGKRVIGPVLNYPNPFVPEKTTVVNINGVPTPIQGTLIQYTLSMDMTVTIIIYDITGHEIKRMRFSSGTNGGSGGLNQVEWDGVTIGGAPGGNGLYYYQLISGDKVIGSGKLVINE